MVAIPGLLQLFAQYPKLGGLFGLVAAVAFAYLGFVNWNEVQKMPEAPINVSVTQAAALVNSGESAWVILQHIQWDCENIVHSYVSRRSYRTEILFTDETNSVLGVALFSRSKRLSCAELTDTELTGVLSRIEDRFYERMPARGFNLTRYNGTTMRVHLCTFCGRDNSTLGVICGLVMAPLGLSMYPLCLSLRKHYLAKGIL